MTGLLGAQNIIHVEYVVTILVIKPIIFDTLARFGEDSARVS